MPLHFFIQAKTCEGIIGPFFGHSLRLFEHTDIFFATGNDLQNHGTYKDIMSPFSGTIEPFFRTITGECTITLFSPENCFVKSKNWPVCV